jgi:hypothetical protein
VRDHVARSRQDGDGKSLCLIGDAPVGVLGEDLRIACFGALRLRREDCRRFAEGMTWEASARLFLGHVSEGARNKRLPLAA